MDILLFLIDFIVHIDQHLYELVQQYGNGIYIVLFAIVFIETGVVVMPFLPGDSLLFATGTLTGLGLIDFSITVMVLLLAAITGDQVNYQIGKKLGPRVFSWPQSFWFSQKGFQKAHAFYEKYGGITIIIARFMPFIRTFAPFVAGVSQMSYRRFTLYNVIGALIWVISLVGAGHWFGNLPVVQKHLSLIIWSFILIPTFIALIGAYRASKHS